MWARKVPLLLSRQTKRLGACLLKDSLLQFGLASWDFRNSLVKHGVGMGFPVYKENTRTSRPRSLMPGHGVLFPLSLSNAKAGG